MGYSYASGLNLGKSVGHLAYALPDVIEARKRGDPWDPKYRVAHSVISIKAIQTRLIERAVTAWKFKCSTADVYYNFHGGRLSPLDCMSRCLLRRTIKFSLSTIRMGRSIAT